jgi:hypothetical protein
MGSEGFGRNWLSFDEGLERIHRAIGELEFQPNRIVTSRDDVAVELRRLLGTDDVPPGIEQWQLPIYMNGPSQFFITVGQPRVKVPTHSHNEGDLLRFIANGSIIYESQELVAGDWMFVPAGAAYTFEAGDRGYYNCCCYQCCCIGATA